MKASIAIFKKSVEYSIDNSPDVPKEVFDAVDKVMQTKGAEILRLKDGFYVVQYSETGPFRDYFSVEWLPVYVARISQWSSGGIKRKEMDEYKRNA